MFNLPSVRNVQVCARGQERIFLSHFLPNRGLLVVFELRNTQDTTD